MTFQKKEQRSTEDEEVQVSAAFGKKDDEPGTPAPAAPTIQTFARYNADANIESEDMCTVLHGYGIVAPDHRQWVDDYLFIGGVGKNIPRNVADAWAKGKRWQDNKPALSRVYIQAILPADASVVDYAEATGVQPMPAAQLAAMIRATDAKALVGALGKKQAVQLAEQLMGNLQ